MSNLTYLVQSQRHHQRPLPQTTHTLCPTARKSRRTFDSFQQLCLPQAFDLPVATICYVICSNLKRRLCSHTVILPQHHKFVDTLQGAHLYIVSLVTALDDIVNHYHYRTAFWSRTLQPRYRTRCKESCYIVHVCLHGTDITADARPTCRYPPVFQ